MSLTKVHPRLIEGIALSVKDFGAIGDGTTDDTAAFQSAADSGKKVFVPDGTYLISDQIDLASTFDWEFSEYSTILNGLSEARGTTKALFKAEGSASTVGSLASAYDRNSTKTVSITASASIAADDVLAFEDATSGFEQFHAVVESVSGSLPNLTVTLDRTPSCDLKNAGDVLKVTPVSGRFVGANFDFNGTTASPRYGFGFVARYYSRVYLENIKAKDIGSKVVELTRGLDGQINGMVCNRGTDTGGTGGHSYAIRVSVANDNTIRDVSGFQVRHVVDFASASRNMVWGCKGSGNNATDFLTHFNAAVGNQFYNCESYNNDTSAYSFTPAKDDEDNVVFGGKVVNGSLNRPETQSTGSQKGNKFIGVLIQCDDNGPNYCIIASSHLVNCEIDMSQSTTASVFQDSLAAMTVVMDGGVISTGADSNSVLANMTGSNTTSSLRFTNVKFNMNSNYRTFSSTNGRKEIVFRDCFFNHVDSTTGNNSSILFNDWDGSFHNCASIGTSSYLYFSTSASNTLEITTSQMLAQASNYVGRSVGAANNVALTVDRISLQRATAGNGTVTFVETRQPFSAATTLGTVNGKVPVYDTSGVLQGYAPVYDNIT